MKSTTNITNKKASKPLNSIPNLQIEVTLSILESKCTLFNITEYGLSVKNPFEIDGYDFEFTLSFDVLENENKIRVTSNTKLFERNSEIRQQLAQLNAFFLFNVVNFDELVIKSEGHKTEIKQPLIEVCFSVALSTIRGMYNVKLENTHFANAIFPLVNVRSLVRKESTLPLLK